MSWIIDDAISGLTDEQKLAFLERTKRKCIDWHNTMILAVPENERQEWKQNVFNPKMSIVHEKLLNIRVSVGNSETYDSMIDIGGL